MKKVFCVLLVLLALPVAALADADLSAMSTADLVKLRHAIDLEIASRVGVDTCQVLEMDGVFVTLDYAAIGTVNDYVNGEIVSQKAVVCFVRLSNTTDKDFLVHSSFDIQATLDGILLEPLIAASQTVTFSDGKKFNPYLSEFATVRPGAAKMQLGFGFYLPDNVAGVVSVDFKRNWISSGYGGFFDIDLSGLSEKY